MFGQCVTSRAAKPRRVVQVVVRIRPMNDRETTAGDTVAVTVAPEDLSAVQVHPEPSGKARRCMRAGRRLAVQHGSVTFQRGHFCTSRPAAPSRGGPADFPRLIAKAMRLPAQWKGLCMQSSPPMPACCLDSLQGLYCNARLLQVAPPPGKTGEAAKSFQFHGVLPPNCKQADVLRACGITQLLDAALAGELRRCGLGCSGCLLLLQPSALQMPRRCRRHVLAGFHVTIFAYGQTGSGKTFTYVRAGGCPGPRRLWLVAYCSSALPHCAACQQGVPMWHMPRETWMSRACMQATRTTASSRAPSCTCLSRWPSARPALASPLGRFPGVPLRASEPG